MVPPDAAPAVANGAGEPEGLSKAPAQGSVVQGSTNGVTHGHEASEPAAASPAAPAGPALSTTAADVHSTPPDPSAAAAADPPAASDHEHASEQGVAARTGTRGRRSGQRAASGGDAEAVHTSSQDARCDDRRPPRGRGEGGGGRRGRREGRGAPRAWGPQGGQAGGHRGGAGSARYNPGPPAYAPQHQIHFPYQPPPARPPAHWPAMPPPGGYQYNPASSPAPLPPPAHPTPPVAINAPPAWRPSGHAPPEGSPIPPPFASPGSQHLPSPPQHPFGDGTPPAPALARRSSSGHGYGSPPGAGPHPGARHMLGAQEQAVSQQWHPQAVWYPPHPMYPPGGAHPGTMQPPWVYGQPYAGMDFSRPQRPPYAYALPWALQHGPQPAMPPHDGGAHQWGRSPPPASPVQRHSDAHSAAAPPPQHPPPPRPNGGGAPPAAANGAAASARPQSVSGGAVDAQPGNGVQQAARGLAALAVTRPADASAAAAPSGAARDASDQAAAKPDAVADAAAAGGRHVDSAGAAGAGLEAACASLSDAVARGPPLGVNGSVVAPMQPTREPGAADVSANGAAEPAHRAGALDAAEPPIATGTPQPLAQAPIAEHDASTARSVDEQPQGAVTPRAAADRAPAAESVAPAAAHAPDPPADAAAANPQADGAANGEASTKAAAANGAAAPAKPAWGAWGAGSGASLAAKLRASAPPQAPARRAPSGRRPPPQPAAAPRPAVPAPGPPVATARSEASSASAAVDTAHGAPRSEAAQQGSGACSPRTATPRTPAAGQSPLATDAPPDPAAITAELQESAAVAELVCSPVQRTAAAAAEAAPLECVGLRNPGYLCFMNASLQVMLGCPAFRALLRGLRGSGPVLQAAGAPTLAAFAAFIETLQEQPAGEDGAAPGRPGLQHAHRGRIDMFSDVVRAFNEKQGVAARPDETPIALAASQEQQDACEFLEHVIDCLHEETRELRRRVQPGAAGEDGQEDAGDGEWLQKGRKNKAAKIHGEKATSDALDTAVGALFRGALRSTVSCAGKAQSSTMQAFTTLGVGIHGARDSLQAALLRFIAKEKIHGFASASGVVEASKQLHVHSAPPVLIVHLLRFKYDGVRSVKENTFVDIDRELTLPARMFAEGVSVKQASYSLFAVINHIGSSPAKGHYVAKVKQASGDWVQFDDTKVTGIPKKDVFDGQAYVLLYQRS